MPEWKQTAVGMIVTQSQYIDVHNPERYKLKFPQLVERAKAEMVGTMLTLNHLFWFVWKKNAKNFACV